VYGAHLPFYDRQAVCGNTKFCDWYNVIPTLTFPAYAGTKLYCLETEVRKSSVLTSTQPSLSANVKSFI